MQFDLQSQAKKAVRRIRRRHVVLGAVGLLVLIEPFWVFFVVLSFVAVMLALINMIGLDRCWRYALGRIGKMHRYDPERAQRIIGTLERWAARTDRLLDALPEYIAEPLYFPDLQSAVEVPVSEPRQSVVPMRTMAAE